MLYTTSFLRWYPERMVNLKSQKNCRLFNLYAGAVYRYYCLYVSCCWWWRTSRDDPTKSSVCCVAWRIRVTRVLPSPCTWCDLEGPSGILVRIRICTCPFRWYIFANSCLRSRIHLRLKILILRTINNEQSTPVNRFFMDRYKNI